MREGYRDYEDNLKEQKLIRLWLDISLTNIRENGTVKEVSDCWHKFYSATQKLMEVQLQ